MARPVTELEVCPVCGNNEVHQADLVVVRHPDGEDEDEIGKYDWICWECAEVGDHYDQYGNWVF